MKGSYIITTPTKYCIKFGVQLSNTMRQIQLTQITPPRAPNHLASAAAIPTEKFIQSLGAQLTSKPQPTEWHTGLVACCTDCDTCAFCLLACACPCVAYGMNYNMLIGKDPYDTSTCCCPCLLFAGLETVDICILAGRVYLQTKGVNVNTGKELADTANAVKSCMLYEHRYAVGKKAGIYRSNHFCTHCAICCDVTWCAPCAQAQLRSEVIYQRSLPTNPFKFRPPPNESSCKMLCCKNDCGCTGCVTTD